MISWCYSQVTWDFSQCNCNGAAPYSISVPARTAQINIRHTERQTIADLILSKLNIFQPILSIDKISLCKCKCKCEASIMKWKWWGTRLLIIMFGGQCVLWRLKCFRWLERNAFYDITVDVQWNLSLYCQNTLPNQRHSLTARHYPLASKLLFYTRVRIWNAYGVRVNAY